MTSLEPILAHVPAFLVVLARFTGLFIFSPVLASAMIPRRVKIILTLSLAFCVYPTIDHAAFGPIPLSITALGPIMAMELALGAAMGIMMLTPLWAVQLAGTLMGQQMGLALAPLYNPATDIDSDSVGQLLFILALAIFIVLGGIEALFAGLAGSFMLLGPGQLRVDDTLVTTLAGLVGSAFHLAMRVSMPVLAIVLVETVAVGFITKTIPALNFMSVGFPLRMMLGILIMAASMAGIHAAIHADTRATIDLVQDWVQSLGPASAAKPEGASGG
ncbi:MAG: flagellar biosynthetic protein FliR [Phycisphaerales bacterium]